MATATATYHPDHLAVTLDHIVRQIDCGRHHPGLIELTYSVMDGRVPDRRGVSVSAQRRAAALACYDYVKENHNYIPDPEAAYNDLGPLSAPVEKLADVDAILRHGWGDCDEHVILLGSMLLIASVPIEIWLSGGPNDRNARGEIAPGHIWLVSYPSASSPIALDTTLKDYGAGTVPPGPGTRPAADHRYWRLTCRA